MAARKKKTARRKPTARKRPTRKKSPTVKLASALTPSLKERRARGELKVTPERAARDPRERGREGLTPLRPKRRNDGQPIQRFPSPTFPGGGSQLKKRRSKRKTRRSGSRARV